MVEKWDTIPRPRFPLNLGWGQEAEKVLSVVLSIQPREVLAREDAQDGRLLMINVR